MSKADNNELEFVRHARSSPQYALFLPPVRLLAALAIAATAAVTTPTLSLAATPGHPACFALEQNCLAYVAKLRTFSAKLKSSSAATAISGEAVDDRCYNAYAQAQTSGMWPAYKATPAIACTQ